MIYFPAHALEFSTILHVALLVFLRLITVRNSLSQGDGIIKLRLYLVISIWILSIAVTFLPFLASVLKMKEFYCYSALVNLHCFNTAPVIGIIIMYGLLLWTIQKEQRQKKNNFPGMDTLKAEENNRRMTSIISRVVILLLICYLPYLVEKHYFYGTVMKRASQKLTLKVIFFS